MVSDDAVEWICAKCGALALHPISPTHPGPCLCGNWHRWTLVARRNDQPTPWEDGPGHDGTGSPVW